MGASASSARAEEGSQSRTGPTTAESIVMTLTDSQLEEFKDAFVTFDRDGNGSIDRTELKALMASIGQCPTDDELAEMIRIADTDGNGDVDLAEFICLMAHRMSTTNSQYLQTAFNVFDTDGNGFVSTEEGLHASNEGYPTLLFPSNV